MQVFTVTSIKLNTLLLNTTINFFKKVLNGSLFGAHFLLLLDWTTDYRQEVKGQRQMEVRKDLEAELVRSCTAQYGGTLQSMAQIYFVMLLWCLCSIFRIL